ncbi:MAG TPA: MBL fold metallo-hydrolase [Bacillota bacterium]|nr:MBL fold metallo-hydrolase [Bacillota bacterium]
MKKLHLLAVLVLALGCSWVSAETDQTNLVKNVFHYYQSTILIRGERTVYFDPVSVSGEPHDADIVFVTHTHGDHFSAPDILKVLKPNATLVITADGADKAKAGGINKVLAVLPNQKYEVAGFGFQTVPAYNTNKAYHPKESNWVGYICKINAVTYYMAGDTDLIPEMKDIKTDVALLPVGGTYTMTAKEAAAAANLIKPAVAVPIHFADVVGTVQDARDFISLLDPSIKGVILKK